MKKQLIIFFSLIVLALLGLLFFTKDKKTAPQATEPEGSKPSQGNIETPEKNTSNTNGDLALKNTLWDVFQKYLSYNKNLDLNGVKSTVYKVAEICNTKEPSQECKDRMNSAYSFGIVLKQEEFKNIWSDEKQAIISTDFWTEESKEMDKYGRFRAIIFFVKKDGEWKMLSFSPFKGEVLDMNFKSKEELESESILKTKDEDLDGISNYVEECGGRDSSCQKTDPQKRDSNNNGWWDGVEALL